MKVLIISTLLLLSFAGCVSTGPSVPAMELSQVKKVAIVGYTINVKDNDAKIFKSNFTFKTGAGKIAESPLSEKVYDGLWEDLKKTTGWRILPTRKVTRNALVKSYYGKKMSKFMTGAAIPVKGFQRFERVGVPQSYYITNRKVDKGELAKALGVDAVVIYNINSTIVKNFSIGGIGISKARYGATVAMEVYGSNGVRIFGLNSSAKGKVPKVNKANLPKFGNDLNALYTNTAVIRSAKGLAEQLKAKF